MKTFKSSRLRCSLIFAETWLGKQSMIHSLRRLFVQGGREQVLSSFEYQIYYSLAPPQKTTSFQMHTGQSKLFVGQRPFKRTKQSWRESSRKLHHAVPKIFSIKMKTTNIKKIAVNQHPCIPPLPQSYMHITENLNCTLDDKYR